MTLFEKTSSHWVRYDKYEWRKDDKGRLYITPAEKAKPELYNPLKDADKMVLHAINTGVICMRFPPHQSLLLMRRYISQRTISSGRKTWRRKNTCLTSFPLMGLIS